jgi:hypothetical protein
MPLRALDGVALLMTPGVESKVAAVSATMVARLAKVDEAGSSTEVESPPAGLLN